MPLVILPLIKIILKAINLSYWEDLKASFFLQFMYKVSFSHSFWGVDFSKWLILRGFFAL